MGPAVCCFSFFYDFNHFEVWTFGWKKHALGRFHFGLWAIVKTFLTVFGIFLQESPEGILGRLIHNEKELPLKQLQH